MGLRTSMVGWWGTTPVHYGKATGRPSPSPTRILFVKFFF